MNMDVDQIAREAELEQNGSSIEEMAADANQVDDADDTVVPIPGRATQLSLIAGGEEPTSSNMKVKTTSFPLDGEFEKGDFVRLTVLARVTEVQFADVIDKSGYALGCERKHIAAVESVELADE